MEEKIYELRNLGAKDIFTIARIVNKIGIKNLKTCFANNELKTLISGLNEDEKKADEKKADEDVTTVGMFVAIDVAGIILEHLPECEKELYSFLADLSGMKINQIQNLAPATFLEMIIDVVQKPEFKDFFSAASKLFK